MLSIEMMDVNRYNIYMTTISLVLDFSLKSTPPIIIVKKLTNQLILNGKNLSSIFPTQVTR